MKITLLIIFLLVATTLCSEKNDQKSNSFAAKFHIFILKLIGLDKHVLDSMYNDSPKPLVTSTTEKTTITTSTIPPETTTRMIWVIKETNTPVGYSKSRRLDNIFSLNPDSEIFEKYEKVVSTTEKPTFIWVEKGSTVPVMYGMSVVLDILHDSGTSSEVKDRFTKIVSTTIAPNYIWLERDSKRPVDATRSKILDNIYKSDPDDDLLDPYLKVISTTDSQQTKETTETPKTTTTEPPNMIWVSKDSNEPLIDKLQGALDNLYKTDRNNAIFEMFSRAISTTEAPTTTTPKMIWAMKRFKVSVSKDMQSLLDTIYKYDKNSELLSEYFRVISTTKQPISTESSTEPIEPESSTDSLTLESSSKLIEPESSSESSTS